MFEKSMVNKMDLLVSLYIGGIAIAELMGAKTFPLAIPGLGSWNASVAIFILPLLFTINDAITEVHGKKRAQSVVRSGLVVIVLLMLFAMFAVWLPSSTRFKAHEFAYETIFKMSVRISAASLIAFAFADFLDIYIFSKIRQRLGSSQLWLRNNVSNLVALLFDTTLFMTLAFYAFDQSVWSNIAYLSSLIFPYWLLKYTLSAMGTPLVYGAVKWLKEEK